VRPAAEATATLTGRNFAPLGGDRLRCVFGEPGAVAGGGGSADAPRGNSPWKTRPLEVADGGGGGLSGWLFGRRLRERMAMEGGDNRRTSNREGRRQLPDDERGDNQRTSHQGGALEVSVPASFVSGDVLRCAAPRWAHAATTTLRVAIHPAAADADDADAGGDAADAADADAADAAGAVLSAPLPFYYYVAGLAPTLEPAPPIGLDISAYLARRVGAERDGLEAGALPRNLTLRGKHLLPFPGAMAIAQP
jgi:hypothetical protein